MLFGSSGLMKTISYCIIKEDQEKKGSVYAV